MPKNKIGVIFDCDGTLVNSLNVVMDSYNYALEMIGEPYREPDEIKKFFGAGADRIFLQLLGDEKKALKAFDYYFDHQSKLVHTMHIFPGIAKLLDNLKAAGIPMGIVTGRHSKDLDAICTHHKLSEYFKSMICDNHLPKSKPAPDGILMAASQMNLAPQDTFYIGDSIMDMVAAHAAGSKPIAALWDSWSKIEDMKKELPVLLAHDPNDIWKYISGI